MMRRSSIITSQDEMRDVMTSTYIYIYKTLHCSSYMKNKNNLCSALDFYFYFISFSYIPFHDLLFFLFSINSPSSTFAVNFRI